MGGTIAMEMAQQLIAQNEDVALLVFLETYNWAGFSAGTLFDAVYYYYQKSVFHLGNILLSGDRKGFLRAKLKELRNRAAIWPEMIMSKVAPDILSASRSSLLAAQVWITNDRAAAAYAPKPYGGKIVQFRPFKEYSRCRHPDMSWERIAVGGLEIHELPFYPGGMLIEPFVRVLAQKLGDSLEAALRTNRNTVSARG